MVKFIAAALLAGPALIVFGAAPALAQDVVPNAAGTGPRIEALIGYDAPNNGVKNGLAYGVGAGFDFTALGATAGVEAEYVGSDANRCDRDVLRTGDKACAGLGRDVYVGGRVGANLIGSSFVYAKAGYTNQRVRASYDDGGNGSLDANQGRNLDGVRVGAGIEFGIPTLGFGSSAYIKTEYRYSNYQAGFEKHQAMAGVGFRF